MITAATSISAREMDLYGVLCWGIWNDRNSLLHGKIIMNPLSKLEWAFGFLEEYRSAMVSISGLNRTPNEAGDIVRPHLRWHAPLNN